jgi:hypothetical protein
MKLLSKRQLKELVLYSSQHIQRLENANRFPRCLAPWQRAPFKSGMD